jgi:hypothetical protein
VKVLSVSAMTGDQTVSLPASENNLQLWTEVGYLLCGNEFLSGTFRSGPAAYGASWKHLPSANSQLT